MAPNPMAMSLREAPGVAPVYYGLVDFHRQGEWMDKETASPANIATQRANRNPRGVFFLSGIAREAEAGREEEVGAAVMNPQLSGLAAELGCRAFRGGGLRQGARGW
ncbi:MAG: hypothetical protein A4E37_01794 [Methanoregulaceae archaeon PtaB.Bin056]|nr:MAG: hypothetical protein A4E37_01794 [Methanoregulaceae archaeon PtaB.Bin056]